MFSIDEKVSIAPLKAINEAFPTSLHLRKITFIILEEKIPIKIESNTLNFL